MNLKLYHQTTLPLIKIKSNFFLDLYSNIDIVTVLLYFTVVDSYSAKMLISCGVVMVLTMIHFFAFFTFKAQVHSSKEKVKAIKSKIHLQERDIQFLQTQINGSKTYVAIKKMLTSSGSFEKINPENILYYDFKPKKDMQVQSQA